MRALVLCQSVRKVAWSYIEREPAATTVNMSAQSIQAYLTPSHLLPKISAEQEAMLEKSFEEKRNPAEFELTIISAEVGLAEEQVKAWFQHRLACWRKQQGLPANEKPVFA